jgi:hypothetical protein
MGNLLSWINVVQLKIVFRTAPSADLVGEEIGTPLRFPAALIFPLLVRILVRHLFP